jgi:primosomal protein N' (replication factor Y)
LWRQLVNATKPQILIGARSALFMPIQNLGLIIIDEFHDGAYKQEQAPHYRAVRVASKLAQINSAKLVLGSATPPIDDYFYATEKKVPVLRMVEKPKLINEAKAERIIVNLASDQEKSRYPLLSNTLLAELKSCLERSEQALLFLNKRGSARLLVCQVCGWHATCDRCDLPYTYHQDKHILQCHTCGNKRSAPHNCPDCGSNDIEFRSPGTKAIADQISKLFPDARVARFDKDNTKEEGFSNQHDAVHSGEIDILVGTQLLSKGHDLPNLALVGILLADNELQFPDYTSEERSYQLLHQLSGRVGRGHKNGLIIIQTYNPKNPTLIKSHQANSWIEFYNNQLEERKLFGFPPYYYLLKLSIERAKSATAEAAMEKLASDIRQQFKHIEIIGPAPSFIAKRNNKWSWQLIIKSKQRHILTDIIEFIPNSISHDIDPTNLL